MASFTFLASKCLPFDALTLEEIPLGGTETAVIRLAEALAARSHSVTVFTPHPKPRSSTVNYQSVSSFREGYATDALILVRDWFPSVARVRTPRRFFWTGDSFDQPATFGIGDHRISNLLAGLICVSAWHAATLSSHSGFPIDKTHVIRNGVHLPYFAAPEKRVRKRLIYSSTPYRGLTLIPKLFSRVREKHTDAEIHIFSGYDVYGGGAGHNLEEFKQLSDALTKIPGVTMHGNVRQESLAKEFLRSSVLFYPNIFPETSCISALEAQAAGCVVLSSKLGALPETVGDSGILIDEAPRSSDYDEKFIAAADALLSDDKLWLSLSTKGKEKVARDFSWPSIAAQFEKLTIPGIPA